VLHTFSQSKLPTVTLDNVYHPVHHESSALMSHSHIPKDSCAINAFRNFYPVEVLDNIWTSWREEGEPFDDFVERVQEVNYHQARQSFCLVDPDDPKYCFPQFVCGFCLRHVP
jgi:hypothetical protein